VGEHVKYPVSQEKGIVERVLFRGKEVELTVRVNDMLIKGMRHIEDAPIRRGETVNVCIYSVFAFVDGKDVVRMGNANIETKMTVVI
jgi:sulfate transport system ATP-binding protein